MQIPRLGVNIDHVATLRQQRGEMYPSLKRAAEIALLAGAEQLTLHLREDRRHIQDQDMFDVQQITKRYGKLLNMEMGLSPDIIEVAKKVNPDWICLVPEKREERTTEGGLDLLSPKSLERVKQGIEELKNSLPQTKISLFLAPDLKTLEVATKLAIEAVEIHTGEFAREFLYRDELGYEQSHWQEIFKQAQVFLNQHHIHVHAGHGLTDEHLKVLLPWQFFQEYNIGHWIISESIFIGLDQAIKNLKQMMIY